MLQLFLGDLFIERMRKYTNQRFAVVFNNTINLETESVLMLEIGGFRFSFDIPIDKPTVMDSSFSAVQGGTCYQTQRLFYAAE